LRTGGISEDPRGAVRPLPSEWSPEGCFGAREAFIRERRERGQRVWLLVLPVLWDSGRAGSAVLYFLRGASSPRRIPGDDGSSRVYSPFRVFWSLSPFLPKGRGRDLDPGPRGLPRSASWSPIPGPRPHRCRGGHPSNRSYLPVNSAFRHADISAPFPKSRRPVFLHEKNPAPCSPPRATRTHPALRS